VESKWRDNIPEYGMWGSGWELAARIIPNPTLCYERLLVSERGDPRIYCVPGPGQLPAFPFVPDIPPEHPHFPWGFEVEPDN